MPGYYAYIIGTDGHIENRVEIVCKDDQEAKRLAKQVAFVGRTVELWQQARKIAEIKPRD